MGINKSGWKPEYKAFIDSGMLSVPCAVTADGSSGLSFSLPHEMVIVDLIARSTATNVSATVTVSDGTNDISDAIDIDTVDTNNRATTIDTTYATSGAVTLTTAGAADRCIVYVIGYVS